jgi:tetratricopeptide (TPR) repeat protein
MVKDAENVISTTLQAITPYIKEYTVLDTGSTDNTLTLIRKELASLPGAIHTEPFINFGASRNRLLELAKDTHSDYYLMLDDSYVIRNGNFLPKIITTNKDAYELPILNTTNDLYYSRRLFRAKSDYTYKYRVHEVIQTGSNIEVIPFTENSLYIYDNETEIGKERSSQRMNYYIDLLKQDLQDYPNDPRLINYLGNTYFGLKDYDTALPYYRQRTQILQGNVEEIYSAQVMIATIYTLQEKPYLESILEYLRAYQIDRSRMEPLYNIAKLYYKNKEYDKAYQYLLKAIKIPIPDRALNVSLDTYNIDCPLLYIELCLIQGYREEALTRLASLDKTKISPFSLARINNIIIATEEKDTRVQKSSKYSITVHAGKDKDGFADYFISSITDRDRDIIVFRSADQKKYKKHLERTFVNTLFVFNHTENLVYYPGTQSVYLVLTKALPIGEAFQTHKDKFKGIITMSEDHKRYFCTNFGFPTNLVHTAQWTFPESGFKVPISSKLPYRCVVVTESEGAFSRFTQLYEKLLKLEPRLSLIVFSKKVQSKFVVISKFHKKDILLELEKAEFYFTVSDEDVSGILEHEAISRGVLCVSHSRLVPAHVHYDDIESAVRKMTLLITKPDVLALAKKKDFPNFAENNFKTFLDL